MREAINKRIHAVLPGDRGSIASALITGKRNAISTPVSDAFYVSSLAHVLAISGYHMAVVAGIAFFFIRAGLALIPSLAGRHPIKKWAAAGALVAAAFYLVLSGASVSTQRAFIMIAIVLIGVMVDRPRAHVPHPHDRRLRRAAVRAAGGRASELPDVVCRDARADRRPINTGCRGAPTPTRRRRARWRCGAAARSSALILASLVAGLATTPYAAFHFHRLAPYGVLANLLAMPVVSAWVMPMGILGVLTMPFGFDAVFWQLMGDGIDWMIAVVLWVAHLPGAVGHIHAFGTGPLLLATAGLLLLCLLRTPLRWSGAVLAAAASLWVLALPRPDILVAGDGQAAAIRGRDGKLAILHSSRDTFAIKEWLMADGDGARRRKTRACMTACAATPSAASAGWPTAGWSRSRCRSEAFAEDCARAAVVVSARTGAGRLRRPADRPQRLARQWRHRAALDRRAFRDERCASARLRAALGASAHSVSESTVNPGAPGRA